MQAPWRGGAYTWVEKESVGKSASVYLACRGPLAGHPADPGGAWLRIYSPKTGLLLRKPSYQMGYLLVI